MLRVDVKQGILKDGNYFEFFYVSIFGCFVLFDFGFVNVIDRNMLIFVIFFFYFMISFDFFK